MADGDPEPAPAPANEKLPDPAAADVDETRPRPLLEPSGGPDEEKRPPEEVEAEVETHPSLEPTGAPPVDRPGMEVVAEAEVDMKANEVEKERGDRAKEKREKDKGKGKEEKEKVEEEAKGKVTAVVKVEGTEKEVKATRRPAGASAETPILAVPVVAVPCFIAPPGFSVSMPILSLSHSLSPSLSLTKYIDEPWMRFRATHS
jgi:hypothetical protein